MKAKERIVKLTNVRIDKAIFSYPADAAGQVALMVTVPLICDLTVEAAQQLGIPSDQFKDGSKAKSVVLDAPPDTMGLTFDPVNREKTSRAFHIPSAAVHQPTASPNAIKFSVAVKKSAKAFADWLQDYQGESYKLKMIAEQTELPLDDDKPGTLPGAAAAPPPNAAGAKGTPPRKAAKKAVKKVSAKK